LFEVDEAVNKIRAEVDPEAELIFGAIEDENLTGKIRVSIVATSLDGQEPETKPVVSMIHRLHNRNTGYANNLKSTLANNQATLSATEGATALNLNNVVEESENIQHESKQNIAEDAPNNSALENVSIENANYLQNVGNIFDEDSKQDDLPTFEVDSIELTTPDLFSENDNKQESEIIKDSNIQESSLTKEPQIFENQVSDENLKTEEPEMFEEEDLKENFEIPAFLRRQKN